MARTTTSLNRILDVLPVFDDDTRIQVAFTVDEGSAFSTGVAEHLRTLGLRVVDWAEVVKMKFDLILAASDHSDLHELTGPLMLLPHGAGFQKYSPHDNTGKELSGLTRSALWHDGQPVPAKIALSHENQRGLLAAVAPELADRTVVVGDPLLDRLTTVRGNRHAHRAAWGLGSEHTLVTVTSTWGTGSTVGRRPSLPARLVAELPYDEFRVAAVLHPNIWAHHGHWQVRHWLRRAEAAGLILLPPTGAWPVAVASADCVIGDHGSLSAYSTGVSIPLLLAAFEDAEVPVGSAMADLGTVMPILDDRRPLAEQIRDTIRDADQHVLEGLASRVFACRDQALRLLQDELYRMLELPLPPHPPLPISAPTELPPHIRPQSFQVEADLSADQSVIVMRRFPAMVTGPVPGRRRHLVTEETDPDQRMPQNAAVILGSDGSDADAWARHTLSRHPGCRVVAATRDTRRMWLWTRGNQAVEATVQPGSGSAFDPQLAVSAFYALLVRGIDTDTSIAVHAGRTSATVHFAPRSR